MFLTHLQFVSLLSGINSLMPISFLSTLYPWKVRHVQCAGQSLNAREQLTNCKCVRNIRRKS